ncbi:MAG: M48 family metallopeptidase [Verrucomicrobiota bacterium]
MNQRRGLNRAVRGRSRMGCTARIVLALIVVGFAFIQFLMSTQKVTNAYTGEVQRLALSPQQEAAMGLKAAPQMIAQHGGQHPDPRAQALVDRVGQKLVVHTNRLARHGQPISYPYEFHLLADDQRINAFALPGGQIFITAALFKQLENEDQLAGVLGHEVGHVIAKHSNAQMSQRGWLAGLARGAGVLIGGDSMTGASQVSGMVNQVLSTKYGREDEFQSDEIGAVLMAASGYDPAEIIGVLEILKRNAGGSRSPEMLSSHPYPEKRIENIKRLLQQMRTQ